MAIPEEVQRDKTLKDKQYENFDSRHRARDLLPIPKDTEVWITLEDEPVQGRVVSVAYRQRSYVVKTPTGQVEQNRSQLQVIPNVDDAESAQRTKTGNDNDGKSEPEPPRRIMTRSRTGTTASKPERLAQQV